MSPEDAASTIARAVEKGSLHPVDQSGREFLIEWFNGRNARGESRAEGIAGDHESDVLHLANRIKSTGGPAVNGLCHLQERCCGVKTVSRAVLRGLVPVLSLSQTWLCNDDPPPPPETEG